MAVASSTVFGDKIGRSKVRRYWGGKAPEWAADEYHHVYEDEINNSFTRPKDLDIIVNKDDPRFRRLAESRTDNLDQIRLDHVLVRQSELVFGMEDENKQQEGFNLENGLHLEGRCDEILEARRKKIRENFLKRQKEEAALVPEEKEDVKEDDEESDEYETASEFDEEVIVATEKPAFVLKTERETTAEHQRVEAEERAIKESMKLRMEARKAETKQILIDEIQKDDQIHKNLENEAFFADIIDTDDESNEAEEIEAGKARNTERIRRIREELVAELKEIQGVRKMTEQERREWDRENPKPNHPPKHRWKFMQKYYHKGAFFQSDNGVLDRDFSAPTGEDKMNKSVLPKVMQVKHFGRSGRTKWTHLVNEDTTDWNSPWNHNDCPSTMQSWLEPKQLLLYKDLKGAKG